MNKIILLVSLCFFTTTLFAETIGRDFDVGDLICPEGQHMHGIHERCAPKVGCIVDSLHCS